MTAGSLVCANQQAGSRLQLSAAGSWTAPHAAKLEGAIQRLTIQAPSCDAAIDMQGVQEFDTYGAWLLRHLKRTWQARGKQMLILGLPARYQGLLSAVDQTQVACVSPSRRTWPIPDALETVGRWIFAAIGDLATVIAILGALCLALLSAIKRPATLRLTAAVHHLDRVGWQTVPIVLLITFLIGGIIAQRDAQWTDLLPKVVQTKLLRAFEDSAALAGVTRTIDGATADFQLVIDVRKFQIAPNLSAEVELGCKLTDSKGHVIATRLLRQSGAAEALLAPAVTGALDQAFGQAGHELVAWTVRTIAERAGG